MPVQSVKTEETMQVLITDGDLLDLLDQPVEVIVNAWNRNIIPWWLLLPQGVSGAIKRRGGAQPFCEVARHGPIPLGGAVLTSAGRLPFRGIIHVAGINMLWRSSEFSVRQSVRNAIELVSQMNLGVATLERRSKRQEIGDADLVRCGIASSDQSRLRGRWL
jgi:O-acetyl-ADP-ribose deacetylase (regulator of RNase III)